MNLDREHLLRIFLDATDDLPDDAYKGIDAVCTFIEHPTQEATPMSNHTHEAWRVGIDGLPDGLDLTAIGHPVLNAGEVLVHDLAADTWTVVTQEQFDGDDGYEWV